MVVGEEMAVGGALDTILAGGAGTQIHIIM